jgi:RNA polymerase sigma-70 factor (ECF subfamily)
MDPDANTARWDRLIRLLQPFHRQAMTTARRLSRSIQDGDDLYQESVLRAFEKLDGLRDEARFRSWFFALLLSRHRSRVRRPRRTSPLEEIVGRPDEPAGESGTAREEERVGAERVAGLLAGLKPVQREAIVLHDLEGFPVEEIARMQGVTVSAVKSRLVRGREALRRSYRRLTRSEGARFDSAGTLGPLAWPLKEKSHE